jgi:hypothetical protein
MSEGMQSFSQDAGRGGVHDVVISKLIIPTIVLSYLSLF